jgi:RimJ/RimL family protein N-acetyltransferase
MLGPTLETVRLILRPPKLDDFPAFARAMADEETARFVGGVMVEPIAWRTWTGRAGSWALQGFGMFSVIEKHTGRWIGQIGPLHPVGWPGTEVGWGLDRSAWGNGYATEAATRAIDWVFDDLGWTEVIHCIDPTNANSLAVARKLGSKRLGEGHLPPPIDAETDIYGQSRAEWRARRSKA